MNVESLGPFNESPEPIPTFGESTKRSKNREKRVPNSPEPRRSTPKPPPPPTSGPSAPSHSSPQVAPTNVFWEHFASIRNNQSTHSSDSTSVTPPEPNTRLVFDSEMACFSLTVGVAAWTLMNILFLKYLLYPFFGFLDSWTLFLLALPLAVAMGIFTAFRPE